MPLKFGRARVPSNNQCVESPIEVGWTGRLHGIGRALDRYPTDLREIAVTTAGDETWVSALAWHDSLYHTGWATTALRIDGEEAVGLSAAIRDPDQTSLPATQGSTERLGEMFRGIGLLLDAVPQQLTDLSLIDLGQGFVAQMLAWPRTIHEQGPTLLSREFSFREILAAIEAAPLREKVNTSARSAL